MSLALPLPKELVQFVNLPVPQSLVLRGPPGSGKTTLCLSLLETYAGDRYFVSNRVPEDEVLRSFQWMGENGAKRVQVIDNTVESLDFAKSYRYLAQANALIEPDEGKARSELAEFLWLPDPVQEAWSRLSVNRPSILVLDSWEALVEGYLGSGPSSNGGARPSREEVERQLLRRMTRAKTHVIFVLEREEQSQLDYLVNGVVSTHRDTVQDRLERWLTIQKLRGVRIENASYPFSLENSRFECILPVRPYDTVQGGRYDPPPDAMPGYLWPGARGFAEAFGRLPLGGLTVMELEMEVPARQPYVIVNPMVAQTIDAGGRVLFVPDSSTRPSRIWEGLHGSVQMRKFLEQVRFLVPERHAGEKEAEIERTYLRLSPPEWSDLSDNFGTSAPVDFVREGSSPDQPGLIVVSIQGLTYLTGSRTSGLTPEAAGRVPFGIIGAAREAPIHAIVLVRTKSALLDPLMAAANTRVHIRMRQGRVFVHGSDPWTPSFVLTEGTPASPYGLLRVV
jgi:KaiC/GvpD/RAD55 family RecA-like ATPase